MKKENIIQGGLYTLSKTTGKYEKGTDVIFMWWTTGWELCHCNPVGFPSLADSIEVGPEYLEEVVFN